MIRHETTGRYRFSHVDRPEGERDLLRREGDATLVLELAGFLFFGSAWRVLERVRARTEEGPALRALLLDFRRVTGVDSSGWHNFRKIVELGAQDRFRVVLSQLPPAWSRPLRLEGMLDARLRPCPPGRADIDRGLEFLEEELLALAGARSGSPKPRPPSTARARSLPWSTGSPPMRNDAPSPPAKR